MNAEQQLLALREAAKKHPNRRHKTPNEVALSRAIRPFQEFVANLLGRV